MMKNFRDLIEDIEGVLHGPNDPARGDKGGVLEEWDNIVLEDADEGDWTPATSIAMVATIIESLVEEMKVTDTQATEFVADWLSETYKWSKESPPGDIGTIDETHSGRIPGGFRVNPDGMTPTVSEGMSVILDTMSRNPPKPISEFPMDIAVEMWTESMGRAMNNGIGIKWEMDQKTGVNYPMPDYNVVYETWKNMIDERVGLCLSPAGDAKWKKLLEGASKDTARDIRKGIDKLGAKRRSQASAVLRGLEGSKKLNF